MNINTKAFNQDDRYVPLRDRRTHGTKQDWPFPDEIPSLADNIYGGNGEYAGHNSWERLKIILTDLGYLPERKERPSERAMRLSADAAIGEP